MEWNWGRGWGSPQRSTLHIRWMPEGERKNRVGHGHQGCNWRQSNPPPGPRQCLFRESITNWRQPGTCAATFLLASHRLSADSPIPAIPAAFCASRLPLPAHSGSGTARYGSFTRPFGRRSASEGADRELPVGRPISIARCVAPRVEESSVRCRAVDRVAGRPRGSEDCAHGAAEDGSHGSPGSFATEKSMRLPGPRGDSSTCAGAHSGSDECVAQSVTAFQQFHRTHILPLHGPVSVGLRQDDRCVGDAYENTCMFLRVGLDDLDFLASMQSVQILPGGTIGLRRQRARCGEQNSDGQDTSHWRGHSLGVRASLPRRRGFINGTSPLPGTPRREPIRCRPY